MYIYALKLGTHFFGVDDAYIEYTRNDQCNHVTYLEGDNTDKDKLVVGQKYPVKKISLYDNQCSIELYGFNGSFNSINFSDYLSCKE